MVLFQRSPSSDNLILKSGILTATFHSAYWIWYITDFIPLVNGSDMPELHIDPMLGWTGFVFAIAIQTMVMVYPKRLVSTLALVTPNNNKAPSHLHVYTYSLLVRPATVPTKYKVGEINLDPRSTEVQQLLTECRGNAQLFRGRLGITANNSRIPFLLEVKRDKDVPEPHLLIQALLADKDMPKQHQHRAGGSQNLPTSSLARAPKSRRGGAPRKR